MARIELDLRRLDEIVRGTPWGIRSLTTEINRLEYEIFKARQRLETLRQTLKLETAMGAVREAFDFSDARSLVGHDPLKVRDLWLNRWISYELGKPDPVIGEITPSAETASDEFEVVLTGLRPATQRAIRFYAAWLAGETYKSIGARNGVGPARANELGHKGRRWLRHAASRGVTSPYRAVYDLLAKRHGDLRLGY